MVIHLSHRGVKKQNNVSRFFTESEYRALRSITCEIIWIAKVLFDLGIKIFYPSDIFCDNDSAIKLAQNHVFHERTKHFEVNVHFIREKILKKFLILLKFESDKNIANIFTKSLSFRQHNLFSEKLRMFDPFQTIN